MFNRPGWILAVFAPLALAACGGEPVPTPAAADEPASPAVTAERFIAADTEPGNWMTHGRSYDEQRFSPLDSINRGNVGELALAWYFDIPTERGVEATPIVIDGTMYVTGSWRIVYALDAATGEELWLYDPEVPKSFFWVVNGPQPF